MNPSLDTWGISEGTAVPPTAPPRPCVKSAASYFFALTAVHNVSTSHILLAANDHGWRMVMRQYQLMPDPHAETGAQDYFVLTRQQFSCDMSQLISLRLILQQPSPLWKDFGLEDLKLFKTSGGPRQQPLPSWFMEEGKSKPGKKELEGVPDLDSLSSNLQQLWALAEEVAANQTEESLGRYEVDGCYDINLLAYS
ncbi:nicolin-1-like [Elysia marginata]|uniref:Nicolin-1-like n=1 Tax=Elysia marginata TaxID=1093978 RepID=A0AAV4FJU2_9GAST|nr:nicolin-1-like [Elysia marginata]